MSVTSDTVGQHGEKELIDRIAAIIGKSFRHDVLISIGDDTAVVRGSGDARLLYTCDMQVQGVHFDLSVITPYQLGRRAMAVNLSDMAAMGAEPQYALVSIAVPSSLAVTDFEELFKGMKRIGDEYGTAIIGGNLSSSAGNFVIDVFLTGRAARKVYTRSGAKVGDDIYVTGSLGGSLAGLQAMGAFGKKAVDQYRDLVAKHLEPIPRLRVSSLLAQYDIVTAMTDVSDGLSTDLAHICEASGVGAEIQLKGVPIHNELAAFAQATGVDPIPMALHGGEEYELLFTSKAGSEAVLSEIARQSSVPITAIGRVVERESGLRLIDGENVTALEPKGWSHFGSGNR
jgi:thiamine-monophosphate kinase